MGTHPIFESDFDCLTERLSNRIMVQYVVQSKGAIPKWTVVELQGKLLATLSLTKHHLLPCQMMMMLKKKNRQLMDLFTWQCLAKEDAGVQGGLLRNGPF